MARSLTVFTFAVSAWIFSLITFATPPTTPQPKTITVQAKMFTRDQLASALNTVVDHINRCNGDTTCLRGLKKWNEAAMSQVKRAATPFANTDLSLKLLCGKKIMSQTVTTDTNGKFMIATESQLCLIKGDKPKCGALAKGKKYPEAKNGATLYCITGDATQLKTATKNLKSAIISAMKKAAMDKVKGK